MTLEAAATRYTDPRLVREVLALRQGDHLCLIYEDDPTGQLAALLPFLRQGLEAGERCVYVADDHTIDDVRDALMTYGVDAEKEMDRGSLVLWTREQWRQPGELESSLKAAQLRGVIDDAMSAGYTGIRFGVEMTWTLGPNIDVDRLRHWEGTINTIFTPDTPARIICQYSRRRLEPAAIQAALMTHPIAVVGADLYPNPYYEAPLFLDSPTGNGHAPSAETADAEARRADWMLSQLRWARAYEEEREQRVRMETELHEAEEAKRQVEELYAIAQKAADDLRKANAAKDEFIGLVSHELRTPITVILGNAQLMLRTLTLESPYKEAMVDIRAEADRLNRIVTNLLVLARLEGGHEPGIEPILIAPILERLTEEHRRRHPARNVGIRYVSIGKPSLGNEVYIEQILANLLNNAEKYSPDGSDIEVEVTEEGDRRVVRVMDRGIGIGDDEADAVFDTFYRSDAATRVSQGLGIGLAVCRRLIEAQGGQIWAKSRDGGGAEFGFALKLHASPND